MSFVFDSSLYKDFTQSLHVAHSFSHIWMSGNQITWILEACNGSVGVFMERTQKQTKSNEERDVLSDWMPTNKNTKQNKRTET